jgi:hypothetical protein
MTLVLLPLLPLLALQTTTPSSVASTCAQLVPLLALDDAALREQLAPAWSALPGAMSQRLRAEAAHVASTPSSTSMSSAAAVGPTRRAIALYCPSAARNAALDPARLRALGRDERFSGVRHDDDLGDNLAARFGAWLEQLLESDAMIAFSEQTRTVYLTLLALVSVVVAWRLRRRPPPAHITTAEREQRLRDKRVLRVDELLREADAVLEHDPRSATLLVRQALLVRVGEVQHDDEVGAPAHTSTEICARLPATTAQIVGPVLTHFDRVYFGGTTTTTDARGVRDDVKQALRRLETR